MSFPKPKNGAGTWFFGLQFLTCSNKTKVMQALYSSDFNFYFIENKAM